MKIKSLLLTFVLSVALLVGAMFPLRVTSAQFIDRITRPCAAGATPRALVIANPNSNNNVEITTCTGGSLLLNGAAVIAGGATINPTNGVIPYRSNATTFSDSPLTRTSAALITSTAGIVFSADNTLDIGASGATRPRTGFFGTSLISPLFNGLAITNNGTNTLNIATGKTVTVSNTITQTATDGATIAFGLGGTVVYSGLITGSGLTQNTARLLGRSTAALGAIEEITLGTNLSFTGTTLNVAGSGVTINSTNTVIPYRSSATAFADSPLSRFDANTIEQRNGTTAQAHHTYNTFTDTSNYQRVSVGSVAGGSASGIEAKGIGTGVSFALDLASADGNVYFNTNTIRRFGVAATANGGHFFAQLDNTYDIGIPGNAARTVYAATSVNSKAYLTATNCSDSAGAAACGSAAAGSVVIDAGASTVVVSTTAVTANSQIIVQYDSSLGARLSVTCNTTPALPSVTARTAATSFTITVPAAPITNPACYSYLVVN